MLRMFRVRRYRVFLAVAVLVVFLVVRYTRSEDWRERHLSAAQLGLVSKDGKKQEPIQKNERIDLQRNGQVDIQKDVGRQTTQSAALAFTTPALIQTIAPTAAAIRPVVTTKPELLTTFAPTVPPIKLPDRKNVSPKVAEDGGTEIEDIYPVPPPGRQEPIFTSISTTIYWHKQPEHFPIPTESLIRLPTSTPKAIPKIQYVFGDETRDAKINREKKQNLIKGEFKKAWAGYKKYAWLHDEIAPVTGKFRDPFCGWAATLVDALDTLWIMGLQEEFEEAVRAVGLIDFTTTQRAEIPLFETTIRYLGGLLAAYDVSGGSYKILLDKAVELAEILMGAFDTPNRMPELYVKWKPAFASQPKRASRRSNLAELGSLSVEFTRLAQLTKDNRFYDAIDRITNAFLEYQERGTKLGGVFPHGIDATGCNHSVPLDSHKSMSEFAKANKLPTQEPEGHQSNMPQNVAEPRPKKMSSNPGETLEMDIIPGTVNKAVIDSVGGGGHRKRSLNERGNTNGLETQRSAESNLRNALKVEQDSNPGLPSNISEAKSQLGHALGDWDCTPQGLSSSNPPGVEDSFSMAGGADSTYEYFPKQYLLLGGREDKYRKMYLKTADEIRKWMLYRPMLPDNRDILFSGSVTTKGHPETDAKLEAEVTHLTCFIGGMMGMSAKIFNIAGDLEIAKKLTDGCVWAYESMPSGIMPEAAELVACESADHCTWNETAYWLQLDPMGSQRDVVLEKYLQEKAAMDAEALTAVAPAPMTLPTGFPNGLTAKAGFTSGGESRMLEGEAVSGGKPKVVEYSMPAPQKTLEPGTLHKRQSNPKDDKPLEITHNFKQDIQQAKAQAGTNTLPDPESVPLKITHDFRSPASAPGAGSPGDGKVLAPIQVTPYQSKVLSTEQELEAYSAGRQALEQHRLGTPTLPTLPQSGSDPLDPMRPSSHKEYVEARIKQASLPPGYVRMKSKKYILRPEAIESVWYMYRITGDSTWQDKGWKMFQSIINATSTTYGHSAINNVATTETYQLDEMESFWLAETLKYFYLLFSTPDIISLDDWVLNTEAHPFKREV